MLEATGLPGAWGSGHTFGRPTIYWLCTRKHRGCAMRTIPWQRNNAELEAADGGLVRPCPNTNFLKKMLPDFQKSIIKNAGRMWKLLSVLTQAEKRETPARNYKKNGSGGRFGLPVKL